MVWIGGGEFLMGSDHHYPEEAPAHRVSVDGFWIDACTVTNREFARFVEQTGYVTSAERPANPDDYPGANPAMDKALATGGRLDGWARQRPDEHVTWTESLRGLGAALDEERPS